MPSSRPSKPRPHTRRLRCEALEDRRVLAVFTVDSIEDSGPGTLREAIGMARATNDGIDEIVLTSNLAGETITLDGRLAIERTEVVIDGSQLTEPVTITTAESFPDILAVEGNSHVVVRGVTLQGNIENQGSLSLEDTTVSHAFETGRGVVENYGVINIIRSAFHSNTTSDSLFYNAGEASIIDSTFSHNRSYFIDSSPPLKYYVDTAVIKSTGRLTIDRSTIVAGPDPHGELGAAIDFISRYSLSDAVTVNGSIIDGAIRPSNTGPSAPDELEARFVGSHNLFTDKTAIIEGSDNLLGVSPLLAPLANNGGPTLTRALLPGSPALDAGAAATDPTWPVSDARGGLYRRAADGGSGIERTDIGAYEAQAKPTRTPGDFNGDGVVNAADYTVWRDEAGTSVAPLSGADATGDGFVDETDAVTWRTHYRYVPVGSTLVVNDLGDHDDLDIENGSTTLREALRFANDTLWANRIIFDAALDGATIRPEDRALGAYSFAFVINDELTIDATMLPNGFTIDTSEVLLDPETEEPSLFFRTLEKVFWIRSPNDRSANSPLPNLDYRLVSSDFPVTISGINFKHSVTGRQSDFITASILGELTITDADFILDVDPRSSPTGFGYAAKSYSRITIVDSTLQGVGLASSQSIDLVRSNIVGNEYSPAIAGTDRRPPPDAQAAPSIGSVTLTDSLIADGAMDAIVWPGDVELTRSRIENNEGTGILTYSDVTLRSSEIAGNRNQSGNSRRGGGIHVIGGRVELYDSSVVGNIADEAGGIYLSPDPYDEPAEELNHGVTLIRSTVANNTSNRKGSGIQSAYSVLINQSSVYGNLITSTNYYSEDNAAILLENNWDVAARIDIIDSAIVGNRIEHSGVEIDTYNIGFPHRAVSAGQSAEGVFVVRSHITDNSGDGVAATSVVDSIISRNGGTGVRAASEQLIISGSTISGNRIGVSGDIVHLEDTVVRSNRNAWDPARPNDRPEGAGVVAGRVYLDRSTIAENVLDQGELGGDPRTTGGTGISASFVIATDSTIRDNHALIDYWKGGGIAANSIELHRTTVSGNTTEGLNGHGGGIYATGGVTLVQSTVSGNQTLGPESHGGGIYAGVLEVHSSSIADNATADPSSEGGGVFLTSSQLFYNTIIADNTAAVGPDVRSDGVANQIIDHSLIGDTSGFIIRNATDTLLDIDPLLGPLTDNGGPTLTHALMPGSPAINAGDPSRTAIPWESVFGPFEGLTDQRGEGFPRVTDGGVPGVYRIDIGAVEFPGETAPAEPPAAIAPLTTRGRAVYPVPIRATFDLPVDADDTDLALLLIASDSVTATEGDNVQSTLDIESEEPADESIDEALANIF